MLILLQVLSGNIDGPRLDMSLLLQPPTSTSPSKLKKSLSNAEDRRRKSLLPWHRKNRSKSKDRGESEYNQRKTDEAAEEEQSGYSGIKNGTVDMYNSKSSLTSLDLAITSSMQVKKLTIISLNNKCILNLCFFININRIGPRLEPWGTPNVVLCLFMVWFFVM